LDQDSRASKASDCGSSRFRIAPLTLAETAAGEARARGAYSKLPEQVCLLCATILTEPAFQRI